MCKMYLWGAHSSFLKAVRFVFSWAWNNIVKVVLWLGVPLLAIPIRYIYQGRGDCGESGNKDKTPDQSFSEEEVVPHTEHRDTEHRDTEHRDTEHRDTEHRDIEHRDTEDRDTEHRDTEHRDTEHRDTEHRDTEHRDTEDWDTEDRDTEDWDTEDRDTPEQESPAESYSCEYDSTWDSDMDVEPGSEAPRPKKFRWTQSYAFDRFQRAAKDLQNYRHNYPIKHFARRNFQDYETTDEFPNLNFYLQKQPSLPDNVYIDEFHRFWKGNYDDLESVHSYIQWLFPLQEPGVNSEASTLTKKEIEEFCQNDQARERLLESYKLMLDFYGIELCDESTGEVRRAQNWLDRFINLNRRTHNNLRITRILKCLGTLGFAHYQAPLVQFFLNETLLNGELPRVKDSVLNYFLFTVLDKKQRRKLLKFAYLNFDKKEEFVWCPIKIQRKWAKQIRTGRIQKDPVMMK